MEDLVSVIVPVYNVSEYLHRCVDSVINQTYKNLEIWLVDDGSTDGSGTICDEYADIDNRIKVIHKENGGLSDARNVALDKMNGTYIAFVDSVSDERLITGSKDKTIIIWNISENSFKCSQIISEHTKAVYSLCLLTGVNFASGGEDQTIRIWEEKDNIFKSVTVLKDHKSRVRALALTLTGLLITGGDKVIIIYKLKKGFHSLTAEYILRHQ